MRYQRPRVGAAGAVPCRKGSGGAARAGYWLDRRREEAVIVVGVDGVELGDEGAEGED